MTQLLTISQAAQRLGVHEDTLRGIVRQGLLPCVHVSATS